MKWHHIFNSDRFVMMVIGSAALIFMFSTNFALGQKTLPGFYEPTVKDIVMGKADAPVTIVEYSAMTCGACAYFHKKTFPALKQKMIDTGKVKFIMRPFPLGNLGMAVSMLTYCAPEHQFYNLVEAFLSNQKSWISERPPLAGVKRIALANGFMSSEPKTSG